MNKNTINCIESVMSQIQGGPLEKQRPKAQMAGISIVGHGTELKKASGYKLCLS